MSVLTFLTPRAIYCLISASCFCCRHASFCSCATWTIFSKFSALRFYEMVSNRGNHLDAFLASSSLMDS